MIRASSDSQLHECLDLIIRLKRYWELLDVGDRAEILNAIAVVNVEQEAANLYSPPRLPLGRPVAFLSSWPNALPPRTGQRPAPEDDIPDLRHA